MRERLKRPSRTRTHHHGELHAALHTRALEDRVETLGQTLDRLDRVRGLEPLPARLCRREGIEPANPGSLGEEVGARSPVHLRRKVQLALLDVHGDDGRSARCARQGAGEETDGTGAEDEDARARGEVRATEGVEDDREGLGERREGQVERGRESDASAWSGWWRDLGEDAVGGSNYIKEQTGFSITGGRVKAR